MLELGLALATLLSLYMLSKGFRRLRRRQRIRGTVQGGSGLMVLLIAALTWGISSHLYTYKRLTSEQKVAELRFTQRGPQSFQAVIHYQDGHSATLELKGDEWQIDARVLKWRGIGNLAGMDSVYRLERLSGRYHDIQQERDDQRSVYPLSKQAGLDLWRIARQYQWLPFVDALYGSAAYMPMSDKSQYQVSLTQSGLVVRPLNSAAEDAVKHWQ